MKESKFEIGDFCIMTGALTRIDILRDDVAYHRGTAVFEFSDPLMWNVYKEAILESPEFVKIPTFDEIYYLLCIRYPQNNIRITKASLPFWNDFAKWLCKRYL